MSFQQIVTPNPDIPCQPGWCLQYVRQAFGAPVVEPSATAGWNNAKYRHEDMNFPEGCWVPLWFSIPGIPEGHVVLRAPDGSIYSTSTPGITPYHHPSLEHLIWYYGPRVQPQYQLSLQYLGWSEDISNVRVVQESGIQFQSESITPLEEDDMFTDADRALLQAALNKDDGAQLRRDLGYQNDSLFSKADGAWQNGILADISARLGHTLNKEDGGYIVGLLNALKPGETDAGAIADAVVAAVGKDVAGEVVKAIGEKLGAA